jgi:hypothetical protein
MSGDTSQEAFDRVLEFVGEGDSLIAACRRPGMPSKSSVLRRVRSDQSGFARAYEAALEERAQVLMARYDLILDKLEEGRIDPSSARVLLDGLKLRMQLDDRRLSERQRTEVTAAEGKPLFPEREPISDFELARFMAYTLTKAGALPPTEHPEPLRLSHLTGRSS